jgi:rusticyanin
METKDVTKLAAGFALGLAMAMPVSVLAQGMYGGGMMGGGARNDGPVSEGWGGQVWNYAKVKQYLKASSEYGRADPATHTVRFTGRQVIIDMTAVQPGHDDGTFEVHNITNPTLVVPQGAVVHLNLVNMDYGKDMEHGVIITPAGPPYAYMSMMQTGPGFAGVMPLLPWRNADDVAQADYAAQGTTFVARTPGTYWYVCPTPGHAKKGMYGKFVISGG